MIANDPLAKQRNTRMTEILYENAPLVEVICEIRWSLHQLSIPNAKIDPHFDQFKEEATPLAEELDFGIQETVQDLKFPREFRPHLPEVRYRQSEGKWPLFQIGPGVFTVNATPPYGGWSNFRPFLEACINLLIKAYPVSQRYLNISRIDLWYRNAFDSNSFGYNSYMEFMPPNIPINLSIPPAIVERHISDITRVEVNTSTVMPIRSPVSSKSIVNIASGMKGTVPALIVDLVVRKEIAKPTPMNSNDIVTWFDDAHNTISDIFDKITLDPLKNRMGSQTLTGAS